MKPKRLPPRLAPAAPWRTWEKHGWNMGKNAGQNGGFLYGESIRWIDVWWMY